MAALTKSDMAEKLFEELGLNKREAKELVEQFFEEIRLCLENNEQVKLSGFGNFDFAINASGPDATQDGRRNSDIGPQGGDFRPGQKLKARVDVLSAKVRETDA